MLTSVRGWRDVTYGFVPETAYEKIFFAGVQVLGSIADLTELESGLS